MEIISHRGLWRESIEKNTMTAFARSLQSGFSLETDIRDCLGDIVISHDMPTGKEPSIHELMRLYTDSHLPLALNIKADGLAPTLRRIIDSYGIRDYFAFDMSVPDMRSYLDARIPVFGRVSDVERDPPWMDQISGIWLDSFGGVYDCLRRSSEFASRGLRVCIVSPELHKREHTTLWDLIRPLLGRDGVVLCTDYPEQARSFFFEGGRHHD